MDNIIKQSIEGRKNAIFNSNEVTDKVMINKIDDLFNRINDFGEKYNDVGTFESEFANSPLNNEYINIFTELAMKGVSNSIPSVGEMVADRVGTEIKNSVLPSCAVRADRRDQTIRNIPIVGDIVDAGQKIDLFNKFRKK